MKTHHALVKHLKLMQNHEDFELKKLLINIIVSLSQDASVIPVSRGGNNVKIINQLSCQENDADLNEWIIVYQSMLNTFEILR